MKFHHVGLCCEDIKKHIDYMEKIHNIINKTDIIFDSLQNAYLCMLTLEDGTKLELISGKVVENYIKKKIEYYHICYEVEDIEKETKRIVNSGAIRLSKIQPAVLFNNKRVVFLKTQYGLIELLVL